MPAPNRAPSQPILAAPWALPAILALALALRAAQIDAISLWTDEFFTANYHRLGLHYLWTTGLRTEPTSPLYYMLEGALARAFAPSALVLRLPSLLASLATIALTAQIARELFDDRATANLAALLLALAPTNILYAQEARSYAPQALALALVLLGMTRLLRGQPASRALVAYLPGGLAALYLHPTSAIALVALNVATLSAAPLIARRTLFAWLAGSAIIVLLALPLVPTFLSTQTADAIAWIPATTRWRVAAIVSDLLFGPAAAPYGVQAAEAAALALAALAILPLWRPGRPAATILLIGPGLYAAALVTLSLWRPLLLTRTLAWLLVPIAIALAALLRRKRLATLPTIVLVAACAALYLAGSRTAREDWRGLLARLAPLPTDTILVLSPATSPGAIETYAPNFPTPVRFAATGPDLPENVVTQRVFGTKTIPPEDLASAIAAHRPAILIYRRPETPAVLPLLATLPKPGAETQDIPGPNPNITALRWN